MGDTSHQQIVERLNEADKMYRKMLADIAHEYWRDVLVPMCHETGFSFFICNGDYWFVNGEREVRNDWDADKQGVPFLKAYMGTLDLSDGLRGIFAQHMMNIPVPVPLVQRADPYRPVVAHVYPMEPRPLPEDP